MTSSSTRMPISPMRSRLKVPAFSLRRAPTRRLLEEPDRADRAAGLQPVDLERDVADVEVHEVAVGADAAPDQVQRGRHLVEEVVELITLVDERLLNRVQIVERLVQQSRGPRPADRPPFRRRC